jgi:iron(III) transport system substrate-binding protein
VCLAASDLDQAQVYASKAIPGLDPAIVTGAAQEGAVSLYNLNYSKSVSDVFDAFRQHFPFVKAQNFAMSGGPLYERFRTEEMSGRHTADLWQASALDDAARLASENLLMTWQVPNDADISPQFKRSGLWYPIGYYHACVAWNSALMSDAENAAMEKLRTWPSLVSEILKPDWTGLFGITRPNSGGSVALQSYSLVKQVGEDVIAKLATNQAALFDSQDVLAERISSGELRAGIASEVVFAGPWGRGAPLRWVCPEPSPTGPYTMSISAGAPHPNAAKLFMAWSLSPDGQRAWSTMSYLTPVLSSATDPRPFTTEKWYHAPAKTFDYDWEAFGKARSNLNQLFKMSFGK